MRNYHGVGFCRHILRISGLERQYHIKIATGALVRVSPCRCRPITASIKKNLCNSCEETKEASRRPPGGV